MFNPKNPCCNSYIETTNPERNVYQLHNFRGNPLQGAFGIKILNLFFADNGFGEYVSFGSDQHLAVFASTLDILQETAEEMRQNPVSVPVII